MSALPLLVSDSTVMRRAQINPEMLTGVWTTIMQFGEAGRSKVLHSITAFADTLAAAAPVQYITAYNNLKKALLSYL